MRVYSQHGQLSSMCEPNKYTSAFVADLLEHYSGIIEVTGSNHDGTCENLLTRQQDTVRDKSKFFITSKINKKESWKT